MIMPGRSYVFSLGVAADGLNPTVIAQRRVLLQQIDFNNAFLNTLLLYDSQFIPFPNSIPTMAIRLPQGRHTFNYPDVTFENGISFAISDVPYEGVIKTPEYASVTGLNISYKEPPLLDGEHLREFSGFTDNNGILIAAWLPPMARMPYIDVTAPDGNITFVVSNVTLTGCTVNLTGVNGANRFITVRAF